MARRRIPSPQSLLPVKSPLPKPSEAIVRFLTPDYRTALMRFMGIPHSPNPPARSKSLSLRPYIAYEGVLQTLAKLKKKFFKSLLNIEFTIMERKFQI